MEKIPTATQGGTPESESKPTIMELVMKMDNLVSFVVLAICGSLLLISPATVYISIDKGNIPNLAITDLVYLQDTVTNVVRWSFFLTSMWFAWLILYFFFLYAPYILSRWVLLNYGYVSVTAERRLEYFPAIFYQLTWAIWFILAVVIYCIIFAQFQIVPIWTTILQVLLMFMVFSFCLLVQRIVVQKIAFDFNRIAYNERLNKSKRELKLIDKLRRSVKKFGMLDLLDVEGYMANNGGSGGGGTTSSFRNSSPSRQAPSLDYLAPNQNTVSSVEGTASTRKRSVPNIVHFFKPQVPTSSPSTTPMTDAPKQRGSLGTRTAEFTKIEGDGPRSEPTTTSSDPNIMSASHDAIHHAGPKVDSQVVVLLPDDTHSPVRHSPDGESPKRHGIDRSDTASTSEKNAPIEKVTIGGIKKRDRILDLSGDYEAQKLAQRVWAALKTKSTNELSVHSFYKLFPNEEEAREIFDILDTDKNGKLSYDEIRGTMQMIYKEKRDLHSSLNDLSHALGHLNWTLYGFSAFITLLISLPIYGISLNAILPFTSFFLALSFVFGGAAKTAFDCIVFLFIRHPYDSGDRVVIDDKNYIVLELSLLETVLRTDGKICYYPNALLSQKQIINIRRSGDMSDYVSIQVPFSISEQKMKDLHSRMLKYCQSPKSRLKPSLAMNIMDLGPCIRYQFSIEYKGNWQDGLQRNQTKSMYLFELKRATSELEIPLVYSDQH